MKFIAALAVVLLVACGGATSTLKPTPSPANAIEAWTNQGTMTCAAWNAAPADLQISQATDMLTTIRDLDRPGGAEPAATPVATFRASISALCATGTDCSNADLFCDTANVRDAAYAAYVVDLDVLRP